jgi:hypothetical protein
MRLRVRQYTCANSQSVIYLYELGNIQDVLPQGIIGIIFDYSSVSESLMYITFAKIPIQQRVIQSQSYLLTMWMKRSLQLI